MKRISIVLNEETVLHVYVDGDQVDLGRRGLAPMQRSRSATVTVGKKPINARIGEIEEL